MGFGGLGMKTWAENRGSRLRAFGFEVCLGLAVEGLGC